MKRIIGIIIILVAIVGVLIGIAGTYIGFSFVDSIGAGIASSLNLTQDSLDTVIETLELTKTTISQSNDALATVETTAGSAATTISDTRPLLEQIGTVASNDVPNSIEAFQGTVPNLAEVAGAIDQTLRALSAFKVDQDLGFTTFTFDLGIDYDPAFPFDESMTALGDSLNGLPENLRTLDTYIAVTSDNLATISQNVNQIADDLAVINGSIAEVIPLLDDYIDIVQQIKDGMANVQTAIDAQLGNVKIGILVVFIWFGLTQLAPLYLGIELVRGGRDESDKEDEPEMSAGVDESEEKEG
jgi:hypothetical protein